MPRPGAGRHLAPARGGLPGHLADRVGPAEIVPSRLMGGGLNA